MYNPEPLFVGSLNGNRTRILALRGLRPKPLDDKAEHIAIGIRNVKWDGRPCRLLPRKDSNLDKQIQSLLSCH